MNKSQCQTIAKLCQEKNISTIDVGLISKINVGSIDKRVDQAKYLNCKDEQRNKYKMVSARSVIGKDLRRW